MAKRHKPEEIVAKLRQNEETTDVDAVKCAALKVLALSYADPLATGSE